MKKVPKQQLKKRRGNNHPWPNARRVCGHDLNHEKLRKQDDLQRGGAAKPHAPFSRTRRPRKGVAMSMRLSADMTSFVAKGET